MADINIKISTPTYEFSTMLVIHQIFSNMHLVKQEQDNFVSLGTGAHLSCLHQHCINFWRESWCSFCVVAVVTKCPLSGKLQDT